MAGNTSPSALIKTAQSVAAQKADYEDKIQALTWNSSAQTDADYQVYAKYLQSRINSLQDQGTLSSASKALTMTSSLQSANRSFVSNEVQRATISVLEGSGTTIQKRDLVGQFYDQAVSNGDMNLAQNLVQQYYSLDNQARNEADAAAKQAEALAKKNATAIKLGYTSQISALNAQLNDFGRDLKNYGQGAVTGSLQSTSADMVKTLKKLGVNVPDGSQLNNGSLIEATINAIGESYVQAGDAVSQTDPTAAQDMYDKATNIALGRTTFNVAGQAFTMQDASYYAQNPDAFFMQLKGTDAQGNPDYQLQKAAINGYQYDQNGQLKPIYGPSDVTAAGGLEKAQKDAIIKDLQDAGFTASISSNGVITASSTDKSTLVNKAITGYGLPKYSQFVVTPTSGGYQFAPITDAGGNKRLLVMTKDNQGKLGLYTQQFDTATGKSYANLIERDPGFNTLENGLSSSTDLNGQMQQDIGSLLQNYQNKGTSYTENTVIPQIARKYFNGNNAAAADAVYRSRAPLEIANGTKTVVGGNTLTPTAVNKAGGIAQTQAAALGIPMLGVGANTNLPKPDLNTGLKNVFQDFASRPTGYTESSIIPTIAKMYFNGDTNQAATSVYNYRKSAGLENPQTSAKAPAVSAPPVSAPTKIAALPTVGTPQPNLQTALQSAFSNFSTRPQGYTENVILKNIAGQFFGGDVKQASNVVYPYRKQNFGS